MNKDKKTLITQSNYIPWKGYFDIISCCDLFVILDDVQYTRRDWRNRNKIKTTHGTKWLSIAVNNKGSYSQHKINQITVSNNNWPLEHWNLIKQNYKSSPHFNEINSILEPLYRECQTIEKLSDINYLFISKICEYLDIKTQISYSTDYYSIQELEKFDASERLLNLCKKTNSTIYVSGPAAKNYMDCDIFKDNGITVQWANYDNYPKYEQLHGEFENYVSIIDMLMMLGKNTKNFLKGDRVISET